MKPNRLEVIDWTRNHRFGGGMVFHAWEDNISITTDVQDDGRTIKVFIHDREKDN